MAIDPVYIWVAAGVVALLVVFALFSRGARKSRSEALRETYGTEYDHAVESAGSRKLAERELVQRREEVSKYDIRPLTAAERDRYRTDWNAIEQHFLTRPTAAVVEADELVADIMRVQGYPMGDFEKHAANLSVKHPRVIEHYRSGHRVIGKEAGTATTEDLRQAMLHYRALFEELALDSTRDDVVRDVPRDLPRDIPRENEVITARERGLHDRVARDAALDEERDRRI